MHLQRNMSQKGKGKYLIKRKVSLGAKCEDLQPDFPKARKTIFFRGL